MNEELESAMPRERMTSVRSSFDDDDYYPDEKDSKDEMEERAPRNAANARERARMRVLSKAFCRLKTTLPWVPADTKLSKLDTLRLAATYIAHLRAVLRDDNDSHAESTALSLTLSWPFAIQGTSPVFSNNSCTSSSASQVQNSNHYSRSQESPHEVQNYYSGNYQSISSRQDEAYY